MILATLRFLHILFFRFLGNLFFYVFKKRRRVALENVEKCYSFLFRGEEYSARKAKRIVKKSFAHLGHTLGDFLFLKWYTKSNIDRYVTCKNLEYLQDALRQGKGVILSGAHFGSWELAAHVLALKGLNGVVLYNKFKKPAWLDRVVKLQRERSGNILLAKQNSFLSLYKQLKKGGIVVLLTDQHAVPPEGEKISLLGVDAWAHTTFVKMSVKTGALIVPAFMHVKGYSKYIIEFFKPIDPQDFEQEPNQVLAMTKLCNKALEQSVVASPHLWMWQHRRFKELKSR